MYQSDIFGGGIFCLRSHQTLLVIQQIDPTVSCLQAFSSCISFTCTHWYVSCKVQFSNVSLSRKESLSSYPSVLSSCKHTHQFVLIQLLPTTHTVMETHLSWWLWIIASSLSCTEDSIRAWKSGISYENWSSGFRCNCKFLPFRVQFCSRNLDFLEK